MVGSLTEKVRKMRFWCAEGVSSAQMVETELNLSERVSIGRGGQVSRLTDMLAYNKWPTDHLKCKVASGGRVTGVPG
jgi:hypothetical protein